MFVLMFCVVEQSRYEKSAAWYQHRYRSTWQRFDTDETL